MAFLDSSQVSHPCGSSSEKRQRVDRFVAAGRRTDSPPASGLWVPNDGDASTTCRASCMTRPLARRRVSVPSRAGRQGAATSPQGNADAAQPQYQLESHGQPQDWFDLSHTPLDASRWPRPSHLRYIWRVVRQPQTAPLLLSRAAAPHSCSGCYR